MARKIITQVTDDIDGTEGASTVTFSFEGVNYEIDLSPENRDKFLTDLDPFITASRRVGGKKSSSKIPTTVDLNAVREWAKLQGYEVSDRGRVPGKILEAYAEAH
jgi:hypothetical protein